ncbi:hypothetical protein N1030_11640 [Desulfovibrio mangrovi]|uniref:hypothetical protein n=1 Tax=Desulfovibrio mangrovi TaxID=2976983 RepID=UPI0022473122|nr:hypothetical protein [Desulfovibrio mangrovi]UZP66267.1 hypothetical protein N1030_11640 [Desulfovibrio mangrovi]
MAATEFGKAVEAISEVLMFENWLRFYFIAEEGEKLFIRVPEQGQMRIRENHPALFALVEDMNDKEITPETSRMAVCNFVSSEIEGSVVKAGMGGRVFDSQTFQFEMHLFGTWVQSHEEQLDKGFLDFNTWKNLYAEWKKSDKVREHIEQLRDAMTRSSQPDSGLEQ